MGDLVPIQFVIKAVMLLMLWCCLCYMKKTVRALTFYLRGPANQNKVNWKGGRHLETLCFRYLINSEGSLRYTIRQMKIIWTVNNAKLLMYPSINILYSSGWRFQRDPSINIYHPSPSYCIYNLKLQLCFTNFRFIDR